MKEIGCYKSPQILITGQRLSSTQILCQVAITRVQSSLWLPVLLLLSWAPQRKWHDAKSWQGALYTIFEEVSIFKKLILKKPMAGGVT